MMPRGVRGKRRKFYRLAERILIITYMGLLAEPAIFLTRDYLSRAGAPHRACDQRAKTHRPYD